MWPRFNNIIELAKLGFQRLYSQPMMDWVEILFFGIATVMTGIVAVVFFNVIKSFKNENK